MALGGSIAGAAKAVLTVDSSQFDRGLREAQSRFHRTTNEIEHDTERMGRGILAGSGAFSHLGRSIAFASGSFLGAAGFTAVVKQSIGAASDLHEQMNKVDVVFRGSAEQVQRWSETTAKGLGIARGEALGFAATFGNLLVPMGLTRDRAADMSTHLVKLAADMASFNNANPADVLQAIQSGLAGQIRPLREYGVFLDQTRIKAEALRLGLVKSTVDQAKVADSTTALEIAQAKLTKTQEKYGAGTTQVASATLAVSKAHQALERATNGSANALTAAQKAQATYSIILKDTADAQGDFARTSGGLANQTRILHAEVTDMEEKLGKALLPTVLKVVRSMTDWLGNTRNQQTVQRDLNKVIATTTEVLTTLSSAARRATGIWGDFREAVGGTSNALKILIGTAAAWKATSLIATLTGVGRAAGPKGAAGEVALLNTRLKTLAGIGVVTLAVELDLSLKTGLQKLVGKDLGRALWDMANFGSGGLADLASLLGGRAAHAVGSLGVALFPGGPSESTPGPAGSAGAEAGAKAAAGTAHGAPGATTVRGGAVSQIALAAARSPGAAATSFHLQSERTPYDCSAFAQAVFKQAGISIGSTTYTQIAGGRPVSIGDLQADDLVFFNYGTERWPGHVAIYVGGGSVVHDHGASGGVAQTSLANLSSGSNHRPEARCYIATHVHAGSGAATGGAATTTPAAPTTPMRPLHVGTTPKLPPPYDPVPKSLEVDLARAGTTRTTRDDLAILRRILAALRGERLPRGADDQITYYNTLRDILNQIADLTKVKGTADLIPLNLQQALAHAATTRGSQDDIKALDNAIRFIERRLHQTDIGQKSRIKLEKLLRTLEDKRNKLVAPIEIKGIQKTLPRLPSITGVTKELSDLQSGQGTRAINVPGIGKILTAFSLTPTVGAWNKILGQLKKKYVAANKRLVALRRSLAKAHKQRFPNKTLIAWLNGQIAGLVKLTGEIKTDIGTAVTEINLLKKDQRDKAQQDADEADAAAEAGAENIPVSIQQALADAELAGDVPGQVAALQSEAAFLQGELSSGTVVTASGRVIDLTPEARVAVTSALSGVQGQITSLTTPPPTDTTTAAAADTGTTDTGTTDVGTTAPVAVADPLVLPTDLQQRFADANLSGDPLAMATPLAIEDNWLTGLINGGGLTADQLVQATNMLADVRRQERDLQPAAPEAAAPPDPNQIPADLRLAVVRAQGTPGTADDLVALRGERGFIQGRIAATTDPELLITLTDSLNGINSQIDDMIKNQETQIDQQAQFQEFFTGLRGLRGFESNILGSALGGSLIQVTNYFAQGPDDPHTFSAGVSFELRALVA